MRVVVFGAGYVGLVTAACFADVGNQVTVIDVNQARLQRLQAGESPIFEPGLDALLVRNLQTQHLSFSADPAVAKTAEVIFIAVGTPPQPDGSVLMDDVYAVARTIGQFLDHDAVIVNKSTVPVGSSQAVQAIISKELASRQQTLAFDVVSNPEFLKEGSAINDFMRPDRIVIGSTSAKAIDVMRTLYAPYNRNHDRLMVMDECSAELTKYAANAMLATKISFMNELSRIAELTGADIEAVRLGMGADHRIGYHFIYPGCGYGGSCFPKDINALIHFAKENGYEPELLQAVDQVNTKQKAVLFDKVKAYFGSLTQLRIAVWGLAFKPNTDDIRDAPSQTLINSLLQAGAQVQAYDPQAVTNYRKRYPNQVGLSFGNRAEAVLEGADALVIVTEWQEFKSPDFVLLKQHLKQPIIFDGRNLYDPGELKRLGFTYFAIGRGEGCASA